MFHMSRYMQTYTTALMAAWLETTTLDLLNTLMMTFPWFSDSLWRVVCVQNCGTLCKWLAVKYSDIHQVRLWFQKPLSLQKTQYLVTCIRWKDGKRQQDAAVATDMEKLRRSRRICCRNSRCCVKAWAQDYYIWRNSIFITGSCAKVT